MPIDDRDLDAMILSRHFEPASSNLAERIITAARIGRVPRITTREWIRDVLTYVLPRPAFALATVLAIGIVIGLTLPTTGEAMATQTYADDEGAVL